MLFSLKPKRLSRSSKVQYRIPKRLHLPYSDCLNLLPDKDSQVMLQTISDCNHLNFHVGLHVIRKKV